MSRIDTGIDCGAGRGVWLRSGECVDRRGDVRAEAGEAGVRGRRIEAGEADGAAGRVEVEADGAHRAGDFDRRLSGLRCQAARAVAQITVEVEKRSAEIIDVEQRLLSGRAERNAAAPEEKAQRAVLIGRQERRAGSDVRRRGGSRRAREAIAVNE